MGQLWFLRICEGRRYETITPDKCTSVYILEKTWLSRSDLSGIWKDAEEAGSGQIKGG